MSHSYEADELVFRKLREAGKTSWDEQADPHASFDRFVMRPFLEESLEKFSGRLERLSALEIGCGSGPVACFLASRGLTVRGIDVSATALEMARQNAAERGLRVQFDLADICKLSEQGEVGEGYDFIIDGHCLHCLVLDEDRRGALSAIGRLLKPGGLLLMETMVRHPDLVVKGNYRIDVRGVLSIRVDDAAGAEGTFESEGQWFAPYRRLLSPEEVLAELREAGLAVQFQRTVAQNDTRKPMLMQVRAGR